MILQKELKLYRFKNRDPFHVRNEKYDYQLFRNKQVVTNILSNDEFSSGKVVDVSGTLKMDLVRHTGNISLREMEDSETYLIPVIIVN